MPTNIYNYRKIWSDANGLIPKDADGRTYEIHHKDGNKNHNYILNLTCVSIQEHYYIHLAQDDYYAAFSIGKRMKISPEELSKLSSLTQQKRVENGTHPLLKRPDGSSVASDQKNNPDYISHFCKRPDGSSSGGDATIKRLKNGTHNFQIIYSCPHCNKSGKGSVMKRWHFDNCELL